MSISYEYAYESCQFPFIRRQGSSVWNGNWYFLCRTGLSPRAYGTGNGNTHACAYILGLCKVKLVNNVLAWCLGISAINFSWKTCFYIFIISYILVFAVLQMVDIKCQKIAGHSTFCRQCHTSITCMKGRARLQAKCLVCSTGNMSLICFFLLMPGLMMLHDLMLRKLIFWKMYALRKTGMFGG
jgi:hypothetical protein